MSKTTPSKFKKWIDWLDEHLLFLLAGFLLAFIPLWPKIPIFSPIEQYIVRVRLEDFVLFAAGLVWLVQVIRGKIKWKTPMFWAILAYALVGALSLIIAVVGIKTIPFQPLHVGKSVLHLFRYLEYFGFFFIVYSSIKKRSHVVAMISIFVLTVFTISIYGYGQKYFYWPLYSTMNREFSKGVRLYLTQYARVQSTFGGHYDMAAYLVVVLPILLALAFQAKNRWISTGLHWTFWLGTWLLILSASRIPFAAFLLGMMLVIFVTAWLQETWIKRIKFAFTRSLFAMIMVTIISYYFGSDLFDRLNHVVTSYPALQRTVDNLNNQRRAIISDEKLANLPLTPDQLQAILPKGQPPSNGISTDDIAAAASAAQDVASLSDVFQPVPVNAPKSSPSPKPNATNLPKGVYEDIPEAVIEVATISPTGETIVTKVVKKRVYSECTNKKELSLCIRLDSLWPRAIEGFLTNPITGSGYATLTKESVEQFTEADSTDNNFLRVLGETGALGFITFFGCVSLVLWYAVQNLKNEDTLKSALSVGLLCGTIGLLLNAVYIDVFAASKVALTYWGLAGLFIGFVSLQEKPSK